VYGPEGFFQTPLANSHIVVSRDRGTGDNFMGAESNTRNPNVVQTFGLGSKCRVYAKSTLAGANIWDHERLAGKIMDQIVIALTEIIVARKNEFRPSIARLLTAAELKEPELQRWAGVVYELKFKINRSILDVPYDGESADEATMGTGITTVGATIDTSGSPGGSTVLPNATTREEQ
jgi:hypothetical protein